MAEKNNERFIRTLLAIGFLCIFVGITCLLMLPAKKAEGFLSIFFIVLMFIAAVVIYVSLVFRKSILLYVGLNLLIYSVAALVANANPITLGLNKLWPLVMISFGITLVPSGYLKYKKIRTVYIIPASALVFLGTVFALFAFHIIKTPFRIFVAYMWPVILIGAGLVLVGYYIYSLNNKEKFIDDSDDSELEIPYPEKNDE